MKKILILIVALGILSCNSEKAQIENVASFKGQQVTGVSVSEKG